jgi:hypothetical protein
VTDRPRDPAGRPLNARPRDELGRPLPDGAAGVPRVDESVVLTPDDALEQAQRWLDGGRPFHAHEVLEGAWRHAPAAERDLWQGLAQLAVGLTHLLRGNTSGAHTVLLRGRDHVQRHVASPPHGIDADGLVRWADEVLAGRHTHPPRLR